MAPIPHKRLTKDLLPHVIDVHRVCSFVCLNPKIKRICYCPNCLLPEIDADYYAGATVYCTNCKIWLARKDLIWMDSEVYLELLKLLPLKYGGDVRRWIPDANELDFPNICYDDLSIEKLFELDNVI